MNTKQTLDLANKILTTDQKSVRQWYNERSKITYISIRVDCPPSYYNEIPLLNLSDGMQASCYNIPYELQKLEPGLQNLPEYTLIVKHLKNIMVDIAEKHNENVERKKNEKPKSINYLSVLNSTIPEGGFGRHLTESECSQLRKLGHRLSRRWIVVRAFGSSDHGILYSPIQPSGYSHGGVYVTTK